MVRRLLAWKAHGNARRQAQSDLCGETALHCAAKLGHAHCCEVLLEHRADVTIRDARQSTPLHAVFVEPIRVLGNIHHGATAQVSRLLLAAGCDTASKNEAGETPLDIATARGLRLHSM